MAAYTFRNEADAVLAKKIVLATVKDPTHYQPIKVEGAMYGPYDPMPGQWTLTVRNFPQDMLANIADSIRKQPPMDELQEMAWEDNNARSLGLL